MVLAFLMMDRNMLQYVGEFCRDFRELSPYSQRDVAEQVGVSQAAVCKFEKKGSNSIPILMWYIGHGIMTDVLVEYVRLRLEADYAKEVE